MLSASRSSGRFSSIRHLLVRGRLSKALRPGGWCQVRKPVRTRSRPSPALVMYRRPMRFEGFPAAAFAWFEGLERDNSKAYFTATRDEFQHTVRDALEAMLDELGATFGGEAMVFRQHRDLRFTPDRTPYKTR